MLTRNTLFTVLYFSVAITGMLFTKASSQTLILVSLSIAHSFYTLTEYIIASRKIHWEQALIKKHSGSPLKLSQAVLNVLILLAIVFGALCLFKTFTIVTAIIWVYVLALNYFIQYLVTKNKTIPVYYINKGVIVYNELFIKKYNLQELGIVVYDDYDEEYFLRFSNKKELIIKKADFEEEDIHRFIYFAIAKSEATVSISENIRNAIVVLN